MIELEEMTFGREITDLLIKELRQMMNHLDISIDCYRDLINFSEALQHAEEIRITLADHY